MHKLCQPGSLTVSCEGLEYDTLSDLCDFLCSSVNHDSLGDNLSRLLSLLSLKITFHMLLIMA